MTALYTHQAEAVAAALRGEHIAIVTPAASGKTLCYNLPVLNRLLADPAPERCICSRPRRWRRISWRSYAS